MNIEKEIYLLRHAQTISNQNQILQGKSNLSELSSIGVSQSNRFFEMYKDVKFDNIYISGLKRTYDTIKNFVDINLQYEKTHNLDEICWGDIEGQELKGKNRELYCEVINCWQKSDYDSKICHGESALDVKKRISIAFEYIMSKESERKILIVTHSRVLKFILCFLLNYEIKYMDMFAHKNMELYIIKYQNNAYKLIEKIII
jgi:probable phosphoglycerate mutase